MVWNALRDFFFQNGFLDKKRLILWVYVRVFQTIVLFSQTQNLRSDPANSKTLCQKDHSKFFSKFFFDVQLCLKALKVLLYPYLAQHRVMITTPNIVIAPALIETQLLGWKLDDNFWLGIIKECIICFCKFFYQKMVKIYILEFLVSNFFNFCSLFGDLVFLLYS